MIILTFHLFLSLIVICFRLQNRNTIRWSLPEKEYSFQYVSQIGNENINWCKCEHVNAKFGNSRSGKCHSYNKSKYFGNVT